MREIKFRGRSVGDGEWLHGDLMQYAGVSQIWVQRESGKWNYIVDPASVGQFTGLCDKNGKEIYEGDVIQVYPVPGLQFLAPVEYRNGEWICDFRLINEIGTLPCYYENAEVIGNIYENPELLEKGVMQ